MYIVQKVASVGNSYCNTCFGHITKKNSAIYGSKLNVTVTTSVTHHSSVF